MEAHVEEIAYALLRGFFIFLILSLIYGRVYKSREWKSRVVEVVLRKIRFWVYLNVVMVTVLATLWTWPDAPGLHTLQDWMLKGWLVLLAVAAVEGVLAFFYDYFLPHRGQVDVPHIYRDLTRVVLYLPALLLFLKFYLGVNIDFLTGSFIISAVIGLALQESLGNFFSGIFLHASKPFERTHWVQLGQHEGVVEKIDWRATSIRTTSGNLVAVPNSSLAKMDIINYSAPTRLTARIVKVGVAYHHAPGRVKRILVDCALKTGKVHPDPLPIARLLSYGDSSMTYELKFWITDFEDKDNIQAAVLEGIWYHFKREEIEIPFPIQTTILTRPAPPPKDQDVVYFNLLKRIDFLEEFSDEDIRYLASRLKVVTYTEGEPIIRQGEAGKSFYILREGTVQIQARDGDGKLFLTKNLHKGQFFGEMSLLTGEPRSATVVALTESELLRLDKDAFRKIMEDNPRADELISTVLARRQEYSQEKVAAQAAASDASDDSQSGTRQAFLRKIRDFFSY